MTASASPNASLSSESSTAAFASGLAAFADDVSIPFHKFQLDNGLTVVVYENRRAPAVTVGVWYRVGAKEEPAGKTGFAHLFEHLMFGGSQNFPGLYMNNLAEAGATNLNGTTNRDRTNYYQTVPTAALDYALFAESDRMGHFYETINQDTLETQRGVVQNEKRQIEGAPYGMVNERIVKGTYPVGHPYAHTVIGSMEDIQGATLDDVRAWFKTYYGPSNAVLVLAGDIDRETARRKVEEYFGDIPPGPPLSHPRAWIAKMTGIKHEVLEDRVSQACVHIVWNVPQYGQHDVTLLELAAMVICGGTSSRMYKRLVHEEKLASGVSAGVSAGTIAGQFAFSVTVKNGVSPDAVERAVFQELQSFLVEGPTEDELERVRTQALSGFIRSLDNTAGIAAMLAQNEVRLREPDAYRSGLRWIREATPAVVLQAARQWLTDGAYVLHVVPFPALRAVGKGVNRSKIPEIGASPRVSLPPLQWDVLSNGVRIVLAERHELPLVNLGLLFATGLADDPVDALGIMRLTARTMSRGAGSRNAYDFSERRRRIGAELSVNTSFEWSGIALSAMKAQLDASLELFFDRLLRPQLLEEDVIRERERVLEAIAQESMAPGSAVGRVLPGLMFDRGHPYCRPFSGYGVASQVAQLTRESVVHFHSLWMRPELATLIVVGDTTMAEIKAKLEAGLKDWRPQVASWNRLPVPPMSAPKQSRLYLIDKPDTPQAIVTAATVLPPVENRDALALMMLNTVLGGGFASRLNMNLREQKNWSYGVGANVSNTIGPRLFNVGAPVQIDKAGASVQEIIYELRRIVRTNPVTQAELERIRRAELLRFGNSIASLGGLQSVMESLVQKNRTPEHWEAYPERLKALTLDDVNEIAVRLFDAERMVWTIAGELSTIEPQLTGLDLGERQLLSPDGEQLYA